jgi:hypothetical protein
VDSYFKKKYKTMNVRILTRFFSLWLILGVTGCKKYSDAPKVHEMKVVSGLIIGETNKGLPGAVILVKGTTSGTVTDLDGKFSIQISPDHAVLVISHPDHLFTEIELGEELDVQVKLEKEKSEFIKVGQNRSYQNRISIHS